MKGVFFISFPKPGRHLEKCQRWVQACNRAGFTVRKVTKDTYICSLHFVGGKGPTIENPDPIPATAPSEQVKKKSQKRTAPVLDDKAFVYVSSRQRKRLMYDNTAPSTSSQERESTNVQISDTNTATEPASDSDQVVQEKMHKSCQTDTGCVEMMKLKLENMILKSERSECTNYNVAPQQKHLFSVDDVKNDDGQFRFYTGLTWPQFMSLWDFLGPTRDNVSHHESPLKSEKSSSESLVVKRNLDPINQLFLTLISLRTGLLHYDLAYRFGISAGLVSKIITTWIQFMYLQFSTLKKSMFTTREIIANNLPSCFKNLKGIRIIIDCTEFCVEQASYFEPQGHLYSSYKSHGTYKVLVGLSPTGAVMFVSDAFEGSISDVEIVKQSGFLDHLEAGDLVLSNRRFTIKKILAEKGVGLNIPPLSNWRKKLTAKEIQAQQIETCVKRCIEKIRTFRLLSKVIPLPLQAVFSQMFFVAGCLVSFQEPLVS